MCCVEHWLLKMLGLNMCLFGVTLYGFAIFVCVDDTKHTDATTLRYSDICSALQAHTGLYDILLSPTYSTISLCAVRWIRGFLLFHHLPGERKHPITER